MEQHSQSPIDAKISIGMDKELKSLMESEAKQLGVKLSVYARAIMKNRSGSLLESGKSSFQTIEDITKLQTENERLRLLLEKEPVSSEQTEEIDALIAENEALRADMELLRTETRVDTNLNALVLMEEDLTAANSVIQEAGVRLSNLEKAHETEKQVLIADYEKIKQKLTEEVDALTSPEMSDEEAELILQHEKEFDDVMKRLREEEETSAEKNLLIEELREKLADYENQQATLAEEESEKLTAAQAKITQLEDELNLALYESEGDKKVVEKTEERGRKVQSKFDSLFYKHQAVEKELSKATQATEDLQEQLQQLQAEKEESAETLQSTKQIINQLKSDLEKSALQTRQLLVEQEDKEQILKELVALKKSSAEEKEELENTSNQFYQNAEYALDKYEKEMGVSGELRSQCKQHEELIAKYKVKLNQFMGKISELEKELREHKAAPKSDAYSDLQISKFAEYEMKLYDDCLEFLQEKHKDISNKHLLLASLYNSVKNKQTILVSTPYTASLKAVIRSFRA